MAKSIMIQGTMSNVGKSILTAGLLRALRQDGLRAAPFKSQNMALNSYITAEGLEIGRAQAMQAEAAGIEPRAVMNPILLKPTCDTGSQVIVNGRVEGVCSAAEYYRKKKEYIPVILEAYRKLEQEYDVIVIEGAGSPAEINLREDDIVNMGLAELVDAPVLLAGDIDRGGVFAQIVGTVELLNQKERERVKGLLINKFRGDVGILRPGLDMLEERTKIPVCGVIPYVQLDIDDEDSLTERFRGRERTGVLDLAVIKFPRISNFTDFAPLECMREVNLRYVETVEEFGDPDAVFLPGTKNTIGDLLWMRQNGLEAKILRYAGRNKPVFGICGGYQMLGERICDPDGAECGGDVSGMGLLPVRTVFEPEKTTRRVLGRFLEVGGVFHSLEGKEMEGYEIHMGRTVSGGDGRPLLGIIRKADAEEPEPAGAQRKNVYGCYVHGIFDRAEVAQSVVSALMEAKGYDGRSVKTVDRDQYKERQYDLLADVVRKNADMERIYEIIEKGGEAVCGR